MVNAHEPYLAELARLTTAARAGGTASIAEDVRSLSADQARAIVMVAAGMLALVELPNE